MQNKIWFHMNKILTQFRFFYQTGFLNEYTVSPYYYDSLQKWQLLQ